MDIQFLGGGDYQDAFAGVSNFATDSTLLTSSSPLSPQYSGGVTGGPLPATLTLENSTSFNDYFQRLTFGDTMSFLVTLYGPAVDSPDNSFTGGTTFSWAFYADDQMTEILSSNFPLFELDIASGASGGGTTPTNNDPGQVSLQGVPEPATFCLAVLGIAAVPFLRRRPMPR
jgi:hypothetical protein